MSCLFDSVITLLKREGSGDVEDADCLRQRCVDLIASDTIMVHGTKLSEWQRWDSDTNESLEEYARRMRCGSQWGGGMELVALAHVLRAEIAVHLTSPAGAGCAAEFAPPAPPRVRLNLLYNGSHYTPCHVSGGVQS